MSSQDNEINDEINFELVIRKFSDILCKSLDDQKRRQQEQRHIKHSSGNVPNIQILERIKGRDGNETRPPPVKYKREDRRVGTACNSTCFVRTKYLSKIGNGVCKYTL